MDESQVEIWHGAWKAIVRRKQLLTAQIAENRAKIKMATGSALMAALMANKVAQAQLELLDGIVAETVNGLL